MYRRPYQHDALQRPRLSLGLLGEPGAACDRVALRRPARLAAGARRPQRGHRSAMSANGYTPVRGASASSSSATATGCRSPARAEAADEPRPRAPAARSSRPGSSGPAASGAVFRALQLANFNTPVRVRRRRADARRAAQASRASTPTVIVDEIDSPEVLEAYEADKARDPDGRRLADRVAGQGRQQRRHGPLHGAVGRRSRPRTGAAWRPAASSRSRHTTCSSRTSTRRSTARRRRRSRAAAGALRVRADDAGGRRADDLGNDAVDRAGAERALMTLAGEGRAVRRPLGDDALWLSPAGARRGSRSTLGEAVAAR